MAQWHRQAREGPLWYARFLYYCRLGKARTLEAVWRHYAPADRRDEPVSRYWRGHVTAFRWHERARAWDRSSSEARELRAQQRMMHRKAEALAREPQSLLICIGSDPALNIDAAMLRAVKRETGLNFRRLESCTSQELVNHLRRERNLQRPVRWLHLACHGGPLGIEFADFVVDGDWLSTHLQGIQVLLLAACKGNEVGEWLKVVPHVVSFADSIEHGDAAVFTHRFWEAIALGETPDAAVEWALNHAAEHVGEFVVKHW